MEPALPGGGDAAASGQRARLEKKPTMWDAPAVSNTDTL